MRSPTLLLMLALACEPTPSPEASRTDVPSGSGGIAEGAPASAVAAVQAGDDAGSDLPTRPFLEAYDFENRLRRFDLPGRLDEISGLALTPDGRLFAHDDERGRLHEIDPLTGEVGKRFDLGEDLLRADLEGLAILGERFFLVSSSGRLFEFREGTDRENVAYRVTDSGVGAGCEVEGLDYEPLHDALLLACKTVIPERGEIVVHRVPLLAGRERPPAVRIAKSGLRAVGLPGEFDPSAIAVTPSGSWLLLSGRHDAIIEVDPARGEVVAGVALRDGRHPQSEGLALATDGTLYISDEQNGKEPRLTAYGPRASGGEEGHP